jgi:hypothetical protein
MERIAFHGRRSAHTVSPARTTYDCVIPVRPLDEATPSV